MANNVAANATAKCALPLRCLPPDWFELLLELDEREDDLDPLGVTLPPVCGFFVLL